MASGGPAFSAKSEIMRGALLEPEDLSDIVAYILSLGQAGEMP
jgi:hypothetical protein